MLSFYLNKQSGVNQIRVQVKAGSGDVLNKDLKMIKV